MHLSDCVDDTTGWVTGCDWSAGWITGGDWSERGGVVSGDWSVGCVARGDWSVGCVAAVDWLLAGFFVDVVHVAPTGRGRDGRRLRAGQVRSDVMQADNWRETDRS